DRYRSAGEMLDGLTALLATLPAEAAPRAVAAAPVDTPAAGTATEQPLVLTSGPPGAPPTAAPPPGGGPPPPPPAPRRLARAFTVLSGVAVLALGLAAAVSFLLPPRPGEARPPEVAPAEQVRTAQRITLGRRFLLGKHRGEARGLAFGGRRFAS